MIIKFSAVVESPDGSVVGLMTDQGEMEIPETRGDIDRADLEQGAKQLFADLGVTADPNKVKFSAIDEPPQEVTP